MSACYFARLCLYLVCMFAKYVRTCIYDTSTMCITLSSFCLGGTNTVGIASLARNLLIKTRSGRWIFFKSTGSWNLYCGRVCLEGAVLYTVSSTVSVKIPKLVLEFFDKFSYFLQ